MFERLKALYDAGRIDTARLAIAVTKNWITQEQYDEITYVPEPEEPEEE